MALPCADVDPLPSAEYHRLQRYLELQFEKQTQLLLDLTLEVRQRTMGVPRVMHSGVTTPTQRASSRSVLEGEMPKPEPEPIDGNGIDDALRLPQTTTRDLEEHLDLKQGELMRANSVARDSSRNSFVRNAMLDRHLRAQTQATRLKAARQRTIRETILREQEDVSWKSRVKRWVLSTYVTNFIMVMIIFNAILLGVEIDIAAKTSQNAMPVWFGIVNTCLVVIFATETLAKLFALGCGGFWRGDDWAWNTFDFVIVFISVVDTIVYYWAQSITDGEGEGSQYLDVMQNLRLLRTLRGARALRLFRYFHGLRALILSIFSTMNSLMWTLALLLILFYCFSCIFAQLVTDHCRLLSASSSNVTMADAVPACTEDKLTDHWSNVMDSMLTLFMSITGGIDWSTVYLPLRPVGLPALWLMNLYIVIGFFTILNVVTGVFVNRAIESASADKEVATLKQLEKRTETMQSFQEVFSEMDETNRNEVSIEDLESALAEKKLGTFMESLGISTNDIWGLFVLIDADHNGVVDIDEFVNGCMNLRGNAKSLQVAKMSYENKLTRQAIKDLTEDVSEIQYFMKKYTAKLMVREHL